MRIGIDDARSRLRQVRQRTRDRLHANPVGVVEVAAAMRAAGLEDADACFVQVPVESGPRFEAGAATLIEGIDQVIGPRGLLVMPSYPTTKPALEYLGRDPEPVFDLRRTPSAMGAITEAFRRDPETQRSLHPTHPLCARGRGAEALLGGHEAAPTPFGHGTPFMRLVDADALQVFVGGRVAPLTMYHAFECTRVPPFPLDVFSAQSFDGACVDGDGLERRVHTLVHDPRLRSARLDSDPGLEQRFLEEVLVSGGSIQPLGRSELIAIRLGDLFGMFDRLLGEGITIYAEPLPATQPAQFPQDRR